MRKKEDHVRAPRHLRNASRDTGASQKKSVGAELAQAKKHLLMKRIILAMFAIALVVGIIIFVTSDWFDFLLQRLIQEIG